MRVRHSEEVKAEARRLFKDGMNPTTIGRKLGVSPSTVRGWVDPEARERQLRHSRASRRRHPETARRRAASPEAKEYQKRYREANRERLRELAARRRREIKAVLEKARREDAEVREATLSSLHATIDLALRMLPVVAVEAPQPVREVLLHVQEHLQDAEADLGAATFEWG